MTTKFAPLRMAPLAGLFEFRARQARFIESAFQMFEKKNDQMMWWCLLLWAMEKDSADWLEQKILAGSGNRLRIAKQQMNGNFLEM